MRSRTWSASSASGSKPSARNIPISAVWSAITSTTSLASPSSTASSTAWRASVAADAAAAVLGVDDQAHLADVARPAVQRHDRHGADDLAVVDGDHAGGPGPRPGGDDLRVVDVLLEERAVGLGDAREEALERGLVARLRSVGTPSRLLGFGTFV